MSNLTPPVVPPMTPKFRDRLYGVFSWVGAVVFVGFLVVGALVAQDVEVPKSVTATLGVASAVLNGIDVWIKRVAKSNVPATDAYDEPADPDLEGVG